MPMWLRANVKGRAFALQPIVSVGTVWYADEPEMDGECTATGAAPFVKRTRTRTRTIVRLSRWWKGVAIGRGPQTAARPAAGRAELSRLEASSEGLNAGVKGVRSRLRAELNCSVAPEMEGWRRAGKWVGHALGAGRGLLATSRAATKGSKVCGVNVVCGLRCLPCLAWLALPCLALPCLCAALATHYYSHCAAKERARATGEQGNWVEFSGRRFSVESDHLLSTLFPAPSQLQSQSIANAMPFLQTADLQTDGRVGDGADEETGQRWRCCTADGGVGEAEEQAHKTPARQPGRVQQQQPGPTSTTTTTTSRSSRVGLVKRASEGLRNATHLIDRQMQTQMQTQPAPVQPSWFMPLSHNLECSASPVNMPSRPEQNQNQNQNQTTRTTIIIMIDLRGSDRAGTVTTSLYGDGVSAQDRTEVVLLCTSYIILVYTYGYTSGIPEYQDIRAILSSLAGCRRDISVSDNSALVDHITKPKPLADTHAPDLLASLRPRTNADSHLNTAAAARILPASKSDQRPRPQVPSFYMQEVQHIIDAVHQPGQQCCTVTSNYCTCDKNGKQDDVLPSFLPPWRGGRAGVQLDIKLSVSVFLNPSMLHSRNCVDREVPTAFVPPVLCHCIAVHQTTPGISAGAGAGAEEEESISHYSHLISSHHHHGKEQPTFNGRPSRINYLRHHLCPTDTHILLQGSYSTHPIPSGLVGRHNALADVVPTQLCMTRSRQESEHVRYMHEPFRVTPCIRHDHHCVLQHHREQCDMIVQLQLLTVLGSPCSFSSRHLCRAAIIPYIFCTNKNVSGYQHSSQNLPNRDCSRPRQIHPKNILILAMQKVWLKCQRALGMRQ
ncbi:uncharacterized protein MYCFIDRAFT_206265 [Pseudocercospora fijiensis CIRAD86]|uniref:Uncharacterized protein n=1 Tax=Pseudocercospora fijiensis (strain CIRAD86) TaxID=383855 RepID=N1Q8I3_PSEFD|nr:uncharacterized protein MYCFIDRAFT_206265 [Pseudocercospora fijiensis CIRAD86]EME89200.1 hypothetical protein MYCFIDRAFT_206265 [Pseudocercospora fijiensis CIRAD86]